MTFPSLIFFHHGGPHDVLQHLVAPGLSSFVLEIDGEEEDNDGGDDDVDLQDLST